MPPIELESIDSVLEGLVKGSLTRAEAVEWAKQLYDKFGFTNGLGAEFRTTDRYFVNYWAIVVDSLLNENCSTEAFPYFYRLGDFEEWLAILRQEHLPLNSNSTFEPIRLHQCRFKKPDFILEFDKDLFTIAENFGTIVIRGLDDLDYYQAIYLQHRSGLQIMIDNRPRMSLTKNLLQMDYIPEISLGVINEFLQIAKLSLKEITWVCEAFPEVQELLLKMG